MAIGRRRRDGRMVARVLELALAPARSDREADDRRVGTPGLRPASRTRHGSSGISVCGSPRIVERGCPLRGSACDTRLLSSSLPARLAPADRSFGRERQSFP